MNIRATKTYAKVHGWLSYRIGRAFYCESPNCKGISKNYEWALIKGKRYAKKRENFIMLCVSCHRLYDYTEVTRKRMSKSHKGTIAPNKWKAVECIDPKGKITYFLSVGHAGKQLKINAGQIYNNIGRSSVTKNGYTFKYKNESK